MSKKRFIVELTLDEREHLGELVRSQKNVSAAKRLRAQILLKVDQGTHGPAWTDEHVADAFDVHVNTVALARQRLVEKGFEAALERKEQQRPRRARKLVEASERELLAIAESKAPDGRARWTLHMLADRLVELRIVDSISHETVRRSLKKTISNRTTKSPT